MARGASIILSGNPKGVFDEGTISDTSKPGTCMEMVPGTAFTNGRPSWRARSQTAGAVGPICVLLGDSLQGKLSVGAANAAGDAYVAGTRGFLYWPHAGEELNMLLGDVAGTGDIVTQGDLFGVDNTGKIKADSSYNDAPFQAMESLAALTADNAVWVKYLGRHVG